MFSSLIKAHQNTSKLFKYKILVRKYLRSILDISVHFIVPAINRQTNRLLNFFVAVALLYSLKRAKLTNQCIFPSFYFPLKQFLINCIKLRAIKSSFRYPSTIVSARNNRMPKRTCVCLLYSITRHKDIYHSVK